MKHRPADLARRHGISPQAVRNYERDGLLPPADRTATGYRVYTPRHAAALDAFMALVPAFGYPASRFIMRAVNNDDVDAALRAVDDGHAQLARDRETLETVRASVTQLTADIAAPPAQPQRGIGPLAHRLGVTSATLRAWERAGILNPVRDRATGYRVYEAADARDAQLAHLLRRGGYPLAHIATVVEQVRSAGGTAELVSSLDDWWQRLRRRGLAMLDASARLSEYLRLIGGRLGGLLHRLFAQH